MSERRTPPGVDVEALEHIAAAGGLSDYRTALKLDRQLAPSDARQPVRVVLGGNGSMEFLAAGLRVAAAAQGFDCQVALTAYDNWAAEALAGTREADVWVIWHSAYAASRGETARDLPDLDALAAAFAAIAARGATLIVVPPEPLPAEDDPFSPFGPWRQELAQRVLALLPETAIRFPVDNLQRQLGTTRWFAPRYWALARASCHPDAATLLGSRLAQAIARSIRPRIKAIAVDLDDTLWGGIVGDDGAEALALDPFGAGRPYLALQRMLKDVAATGVPLCVVSKNDPARALTLRDALRDDPATRRLPVLRCLVAAQVGSTCAPGAAAQYRPRRALLPRRLAARAGRGAGIAAGPDGAGPAGRS